MSAGVQILLGQQLARLEHSLQKVEAQMRRSQDAKQAARAVRGLRQHEPAPIAMARLLFIHSGLLGSSVAGCCTGAKHCHPLTASDGHALSHSGALFWLFDGALLCSLRARCPCVRCSSSPQLVPTHLLA